MAHVACGYCINRIRLEFKEYIYISDEKLTGVLIESDWNLKTFKTTYNIEIDEY